MKLLTKAGLALLAAATVATPALAQNLTKERANILSVDWNAMQVRMKDPQGRERTWVVSRDATVEFDDKREQFPNPKLADLTSPMYVHFTYNADTKQIVAFKVAEVGFEPADRNKAAAAATPAGQQAALVTAVDARVGQMEVQLGTGTERKTYVVEPSSLLRSVRAGDRVQLTISKKGDQDVVTGIRRR